MLNRVEQSVVSPGTHALALDYESPEVANPFPINRIRDEAVQLVPGTYLGAKGVSQWGVALWLAAWAFLRAIRPAARWSRARWFSSFLDQRMRMPRLRFIQE